MSDLLNPVIPKQEIGAIPATPAEKVDSLPQTSYMTNGVNNLEYTPFEDTFEPSVPEESHTGRNIALGVLGAAALAALADGIFAKGKHLKKIGAKIKEMFKKAPKEEAAKPKPKPTEEIKKSAERIKLEGANKEAGEVLNGNTIFDASGKKLRAIEDLGDGKAKITVFDSNGKISETYAYEGENALVTKFNEFGKQIKTTKKDIEDKALLETTFQYNKKGELAKTVEKNCEDNSQKTVDFSTLLGIKREKTTIDKDGIISQVKIVSRDSEGKFIRVEEKLETGAVKKTIYNKEGNVKKTSEDNNFSKWGILRDIFRV